MTAIFIQMFHPFILREIYTISWSAAWAGIFLGLIWGRISASTQFKNEQKLPKIVYIIPNFLVLHFGEKITKMRTKIPKKQMYENLHNNHWMWKKTGFHSHFYANFHWFLRWAIRVTNMLQLYTCMAFFYPFKGRSMPYFSNFRWSKWFSPNSTGPWPRLQKGRKFPDKESPLLEKCRGKVGLRSFKVGGMIKRVR